MYVDVGELLLLTLQRGFPWFKITLPTLEATKITVARLESDLILCLTKMDQ